MFNFQYVYWHQECRHCNRIKRWRHQHFLTRIRSHVRTPPSVSVSPPNDLHLSSLNEVTRVGCVFVESWSWAFSSTHSPKWSSGSSRTTCHLRSRTSFHTWRRNMDFSTNLFSTSGRAGSINRPKNRELCGGKINGNFFQQPKIFLVST